MLGCDVLERTAMNELTLLPANRTRLLHMPITVSLIGS